MQRTVLLLSSMALAMLLASGVALALPSERPDDTPMVDGRVRAIEQVGTNIWLGGTDSEVSDMTIYRGDVLIAGEFPGPSSKENNLVRVDGETGRVIKWFYSPALKSVLAAPKLGRVYGGGESLSAFEFARGKKRALWTRAENTVDKSLRTNNNEAAYRDLELDASGKAIWAACVCDAVDGKPAKALVKLGTEGVHDASWLVKADPEAFGISVVDANGVLYLGAGGSDYLAEFSKKNGKRNWVRDTSGSVQVVEVMNRQLVIGGHFWGVADQAADKCGHRSGVTQALDPNDGCPTRKGIAAYSFSGRLDPNWNPLYAGSYSLVWALHVEEGTSRRLHTGGEFLTVNGVTQNSYARLSPRPS